MNKEHVFFSESPHNRENRDVLYVYKRFTMIIQFRINFCME